MFYTSLPELKRVERENMSLRRKAFRRLGVRIAKTCHAILTHVAEKALPYERVLRPNCCDLPGRIQKNMIQLERCEAQK